MKKYGLVCVTMFQGMTICTGDIYDTVKEAEDELEDMNEMRIAEGMDADEDFSVIEIFQQPDGTWKDGYGAPITVTDEGSS